MADAIKCQSIHTSQSTPGQLLIDCQLSVHQVSMEMSIECPSGVNQIEMSIKCLSKGQSSVNRGSTKGTDGHLTQEVFSTINTQQSLNVRVI